AGGADPCRTASVIRPRLDEHFELDIATLTGDDSKDFMLREQLPVLVPFVEDGHEIGDHDDAAVRLESGFENVRVFDIASRHPRSRHRGEPPAAALLVENRTEHGAAVESRPAQPVDRTRSGDERRRTPVADDGIVTNR